MFVKHFIDIRRNLYIFPFLSIILSDYLQKMLTYRIVLRSIIVLFPLRTF